MKFTLFSPALAGLALCSAQTAQAQQACVMPEDVTDMATYMMPLAYDAVMQRCGAQYDDSGFMKTDGPAFADRFRARQNAAWPGAYRVGKKLMANRAAKAGEKGDADNDAMLALIDAMPQEQVRPFVDGFLQQIIAAEIKPDTCSDIERGLQLLAPLPVENMSGLATFILQMSGVKDPQICASSAG